MKGDTRRCVVSDSAYLTIEIDGRQAIPVRAIPYITGWNLQPGTLAAALAHSNDVVYRRLSTMTAYQLVDGAPTAIFPKDWDAIELQLSALRAQLLTRFPNQEDDENAWQLGRNAWRKESVSHLPAGVFVWRDEFEQCFDKDFSPHSHSLLLEEDERERAGDRELSYTPMLSSEASLITIWEGFSRAPAFGSEPCNNARDFSSEARQRFINAESWNERELLALCLGVHTYADRDDIAPEDEREGAFVRINNALKSGELAADCNPDAGAAERMYGGVWRIEPARAVQWALSKYPRFPKWLAQSKLPEIYAQQAAERKAAGRYTLREAAEEIERNTEERFGPMLEKLKAAVSAGALVVYEPGRNARYIPKTVRDFYEEAYAADLNAWLVANESRITFSFPAPAIAVERSKDDLSKCAGSGGVSQPSGNGAAERGAGGLNIGRNSKEEMNCHIKARACELHEMDSSQTMQQIANVIAGELEAKGYMGERGDYLSAATVVKAIPPGLTGGRRGNGKKR